MKSVITWCAVLGIATLSSSVVAQETANGKTVFEQSFDSELKTPWKALAGKWEVVDGVLKGEEIPSDNHSAAFRWKGGVVGSDVIIELKFRLVRKGKSISVALGHDPKQLDKKGSLFSVVVTPSSWKIMRHADKNRRKEVPFKTLASDKAKFGRDTWHTLQITTNGKVVTAAIDGKHKLKGQDDSFGVRKARVALGIIGNGAEFDDVKLTETKR